MNKIFNPVFNNIKHTHKSLSSFQKFQEDNNPSYSVTNIFRVNALIFRAKKASPIGLAQHIPHCVIFFYNFLQIPSLILYCYYIDCSVCFINAKNSKIIIHQ